MMKLILASVLLLAVAARWCSAENWQRTVILIQKEVNDGQFVFLRGGIDAGRREGCTENADTDACAIAIRHNQITGTNNTQYNDWSTNDDNLDWHGREDDQSSSEGVEPYGTPLVWTTNDATHGQNVTSDGYGYTPLNTFAEHFWMLDVEMDCDETDDGWFEFKGFGPGYNDWEPNVDQDAPCAGSESASKPYSSNNHFAKCGYLNKYVFNSNGCQIDSLE